MRKNVAGQIVSFQMVDTAGAAFTGAVTIYVTGDNGAQAAGTVDAGGGAGVAVHKGNGLHNYAPAQAETNFDQVGFTAVGSGAVPQTLVYEPVGFDPADAVRLGLSALPNAAADAAGGLPVSDAGGLDVDTLLGRLDAAISTRLATAGYAAPDNATIAANAAAIAALNDPTVAAIADAVWEELLADHSGTAGSVAAALNAAGSAGDPWATALPGGYGAGTAGKIVGDALDAAISSRLAAADYTAPDDAGVLDAIALAILKRDWTGITGEAARSLLNALRLLRNKHSVAAGTLTVTKEDDATAAWTAAVTADAAAEPITAVDPS